MLPVDVELDIVLHPLTRKGRPQPHFCAVLPAVGAVLPAVGREGYGLRKCNDAPRFYPISATTLLRVLP